MLFFVRFFPPPIQEITVQDLFFKSDRLIFILEPRKAGMPAVGFDRRACLRDEKIRKQSAELLYSAIIREEEFR